ncbi:MAG: hypothetical protein AAF846_26355 [Chloroflexota bacterium]
MGKITTHTHPNQTLYTAQQIGLSIIMASAIFAVIMLVVFAFVLNLPLFALMAIFVLGISSYVLMGIVNTPPITLSDEGITLQPFVGGERQIAWHEIETVAPYPLLPQPNQEVLKQAMIGRNNYQAAEGILLVVPSLPFPYRIAGALAGEKGAPIIALTNRTHTDYETLVTRIHRNAPHAIREDTPLED